MKIFRIVLTAPLLSHYFLKYIYICSACAAMQCFVVQLSVVWDELHFPDSLVDSLITQLGLKGHNLVCVFSWNNNPNSTWTRQQSPTCKAEFISFSCNFISFPHDGSLLPSHPQLHIDCQVNPGLILNYPSMSSPHRRHCHVYIIQNFLRGSWG